MSETSQSPIRIADGPPTVTGDYKLRSKSPAIVDKSWLLARVFIASDMRLKASVTNTNGMNHYIPEEYFHEWQWSTRIPDPEEG